MDGERVLITTFGFSEKKVLDAIKALSCDQLIVIASDKALKSGAFRRLVEMEALCNSKVDAVMVDVFDFKACLAAINDIIKRCKRACKRPILNVSGGTKMLSCAAILAGFQQGVEVYHCENEIIKLPVLEGLSISDRFNDRDKEIIRMLENGDTVDILERKFESKGLERKQVRKSIERLRKVGLVRGVLKGGRLQFYWNEGQEFIKILT